MQLLSGNHCTCEFYRNAPAHHDQLLGLEYFDFAAITSVLEYAATWGELDYSGRRLIAPTEWLAFATSHEWDDPERVVDFVLAIQSFVRSRPIADAGPMVATRPGAALEALAQ